MKIYTDEELAKKIKNKTLRRKIIKIIIYPIFFIILVCNLLLLIQKIKNKNELVNIFGYKALVVTSGSMAPTLEIGDLIIIKKVPEADIKKEDIITFMEEKYVVTHRVVDIINQDGELLYQTKGDSNNAKDADLVKNSQIQGVYKFKIKKIGNVIIYAQNKIGFFIMVCIAYLIYSIISRNDDRRIARHEKRKKLEEIEKER